MLCILKAVAAWVILLLVGTNLIGFVVRGILWSPPPIDAPTDRVQELLRRESARMNVTNAVMTVGSILITAGYLFALLHFWNVGLAVAGGVVMATRIPDLVWEIRTGRKPSRKDRPKGPVYFLTSACDLAALVLVWYSLCRWRL